MWSCHYFELLLLDAIASCHCCRSVVIMSLWITSCSWLYCRIVNADWRLEGVCFIMMLVNANTRMQLLMHYVLAIVGLIEGRCCRCHCCRCRCFISVAVTSLLLMHSLFSVVVQHACCGDKVSDGILPKDGSFRNCKYIADRGPM